MPPIVSRLTSRLLLAAALVVLVGCGPSSPTQDPVLDLIGHVPAEVAAAGLHVRADTEGHEQLLEALQLDPDQVQAVGRTGAPALRVVTGRGFGAVAERLRDLGFPSTASATSEDPAWEIFERPAELEGFIGMPAIAIATGVTSDAGGVRDLIAIGDLEQLAAVERGGRSLSVTRQELVGASSALVGRPGDVTVSVVTLPAEEGGPSTGMVLLEYPAAVEQSEAVAVAVTLRTLAAESPEALWSVGAPLARDAVVTVPLEWLADGDVVLRRGLDTDLLERITQDD
ncbi:hypothetical protein [Euzebya tangerina]|uniref:hypothetical protein n=1 Tax=Euzebya tangerina TaxID=591198 RepID=UPI000E31A4DB|nr:hypothetical protein [Euzebya tangerina]